MPLLQLQPCCCGGAAPCACCDTGTTHKIYQITLSNPAGFSPNVACPDCAWFDGMTFSLHQGAGGCEWDIGGSSGTPAGRTPGNYLVEISLTASCSTFPNSFTWGLQFAIGSNGIIFCETTYNFSLAVVPVAGKIDCDPDDPWNLVYVNSTTGIDGDCCTESPPNAAPGNIMLIGV